MGSNLVKKHLWNGSILFLSCFLLGTSIPYSIPNLLLVNSTEGFYLCLSLFLNSPLLLRKDHGVGWKCFQVLLLLQSNSSLILSICEILRKELPSVSAAILLPSDLWGKKMAGSEVAGPALGSFSIEDAAGGSWSFLPGDSCLRAVHRQTSGCGTQPDLRLRRTAVLCQDCLQVLVVLSS